MPAVMHEFRLVEHIHVCLQCLVEDDGLRLIGLCHFGLKAMSFDPGAQFAN